MVEAAGVEPVPPQNANWLMARDFRRNCLEIRCLVVNSLCSGVRPSLGDILETVSLEGFPHARNNFQRGLRLRQQTGGMVPSGAVIELIASDSATSIQVEPDQQSKS